MTDSEIIKACAELDGLIFKDGVWVGPGWNHREDCKPYLTSRDAIIPVIEKQDDDTRQGFFYKLMDVHKLNRPMVYNSAMLEWTCSHLNFADVILSTPAHLCEALLRATGKWIE